MVLGGSAENKRFINLKAKESEDIKMITNIKVGGGELSLAANAATPFRFKQVFGTDLLTVFQKSTQSEEDGMILSEVVTQLAYIMHKQAENADMKQLSLDDFYAWLEDYEPMEFTMVGQEIINAYMASTIPTSTAKKN